LNADRKEIDIALRPTAETRISIEEQPFTHFKDRILIARPLHGNFAPGTGKAQHSRIYACQGETNLGQASIGESGEACLRHRDDCTRRPTLLQTHGGYGQPIIHWLDLIRVENRPGQTLGGLV
jgi:hypothetical protein